MRASSERANLPRWKGQDGFFEVWFIVVFEPETRRGYWIRYSTYAPVPGRGDDCRAMLWAAAFREGAPAIAVKAIFDEDDYDGGDGERFLIRIGPAAMGNDFCRGESRDPRHTIAWQLHYQPKIKEARRSSSLLSALPLPTRAHHANSEIEIDGWVTVDGERHELRGAPGLQMHLYGTGRLEEHTWLYAPAFAEDHRAVLEVSASRAHRKMGRLPLAAISPIFLSAKSARLDHTGLIASLGTDISVPRPGAWAVAAHNRSQRVRVRAYAPLDAFIGHRLREPGGRELCIAHSDVASCYVEVFEPRGAARRWSPVLQLSAPSASALELQMPEPMDSVRYTEWEETSCDEARREPPLSEPPPREATDQAGGVGRVVPLPAPGAIFSLEGTYRRALVESGLGAYAPPSVCRKSRDAWNPTGAAIAFPRTAEIKSALDGLEPGLAAEIDDRFGALPAMLDYEVELGMMLLDGVTEAALCSPSFTPPVGFFLAGDLTSRACQLLGAGQPHPMPYWTLAKSFPGFLPVSPKLWVPGAAGAFPRVTLRTRVNGELRQEGHTSELVLGPRQMLLHVVTTAKRDLHRGDCVLTGTPSGVALPVTRPARGLGRFLGRRGLEGRFARLTRALDAYARSDRFLLPGDQLELDAGPLGSIRALISL